MTDNTTETVNTTDTDTDTSTGNPQLSTADIASSGSTPQSGETMTETRSAESESDSAPLFPQDRLDQYKQRWTQIQASFVDDPRGAAEQADNLVATVIKDLAGVFADERQTLEGQWTRGEDVSTEDLRVALTRYRSFFDRLLSV
jgi:hypothetical protein